MRAKNKAVSLQEAAETFHPLPSRVVIDEFKQAAARFFRRRAGQREETGYHFGCDEIVEGYDAVKAEKAKARAAKKRRAEGSAEGSGRGGS